jgi:hypothetical protein
MDGMALPAPSSRTDLLVTSMAPIAIWSESFIPACGQELRLDTNGQAPASIGSSIQSNLVQLRILVYYCPVNNGRTHTNACHKLKTIGLLRKKKSHARRTSQT